MVQGQKSTSARSHCNGEVGDDPNRHGTEAHREKSKVADHGSRDSSLVDEESLTSEQVANSATSDRHKSSETSHHGQNNHQSHERRRDICDNDSHHDDRDTRYRKRRSSLDARKPYYELRQRRRQSPSVVRDRYRGKGRRRRSRSHTNSYDVDKSRPSSVTPKKGVGVCNLPTGVGSILLPQPTSINTTSVASQNSVRTTVTATDSSFTVDIDNDLNIESVETEDADNDTRAPREQTSVGEIKSQETEPVELGTSKRKTIDDTDTQTSVVTTASSEHTLTGVSSSDSVSEKSAADIMSDKPTVTIVSDSDKRVDVQCSYLTWISRHYYVQTY